MWIEKFWIPALLIIVTGLSGLIFENVRASRKSNEANSRGIMLLLRRQIISDHHRFCEKGEPMTRFDYEDVVEVHNTYKALGGNGLTDKMYDELQQLDIGGAK